MNINSLLQKRYKANLAHNKIINTINGKVENIVKKIIQDDVVHEDAEDIANMFNDYFVDIGQNIAEWNGGNNNNHLDYMTHINNGLGEIITTILIT